MLNDYIIVRELLSRFSLNSLLNKYIVIVADGKSELRLAQTEIKSSGDKAQIVGDFGAFVVEDFSFCSMGLTIVLA